MSDAQNKGLDVFGYLILALAMGVAFSPILKSINNYFSSLKQSFTIYVIIFAVYFGLFILATIIYRILKFFIYKKTCLKNETIRVQDKTSEIENLLNKDLESDKKMILIDIEKINEKINVSYSNKRFYCFTKRLKKRLEIYLQLLEEIKEKERKQKEIEQIERENEARKEQARLKALYDDYDKDQLLFDLKADEKLVFKKEGLSKNQIKALESDKFKERNEYSVKENKIIRVLVKRKPNLNHSPTHIFLVWDTIRLLNEIKGITNMEEHETVDADITFTFNHKKYALEIERGDLLRKKHQQKEKVEDLNKKYKNRWMFIVSNKNYLSKYSKLGFATQRKQVAENLQKLLEN